MYSKLMNDCLSHCKGQENNEDYIANSFEGSNLRNELLCKISAEGLETPTLLQQNSIIPWLRGYDGIIHACRQTGKKTVMAIAVLQAIDANIQQCQVLILVPHKQRAVNVLKKLSDLCDFEDFRWHMATGLDPHVEFMEPVHVVIATVGCAYDLIQRNVLKTDFVKMIVFENMTCVHSNRSNAQVWEIFEKFKSDIQIILMSTIAFGDPSKKSRRHLPNVNLEVKGKAAQININQICQPAIVKDKKFEILFDLHDKLKPDVSQFVIFFDKDSSPVHPKQQMQSCNKSQPKDSDIQKKTSEEAHFFKNTAKELVDDDRVSEEELSSESVSDNLLGIMHDEIRNKGSDRRTKSDRNERACDHMLKNVLHVPVDIYDSTTESSFDLLNIGEELLCGIYAHNLNKPTPLQQKVIVQCIQGFDVVVQGLPGTGKKTAVSVAALQRTNTSLQCCQVLMLTPDRDTAQYLVEILNHLGSYMKVRCCSCIGKGDIENLCKLLTGAHIVVGTAQSIYKVIQHKTLVTDHIKLLVLENVGRMLSPKLRKLTHSVVETLNSDVQKIFLSSFMTVQHVDELVVFLKSPIYIVPKDDEFTIRNRRQYYIQVAADLKFKTLCNLYKALKNPKAVIFCNTENDVNWLAEAMRNKGFSVSAIQSNMMYKERVQILNQFFSADSHTLITTGSIGSSRVPYVALVINFQVPFREDIYIRRISRHSKGVSISIVTQSENRCLERMKKFYSTRIRKLQTYDVLLAEFSTSGAAQEVNDEKICTDDDKSNSLDFVSEKYFYSYTSAVESTFKDIDLQEKLLEGIQKFGFERPTPLQYNAIVPFMEGHNIVIHAHPDTGKKTFVSIAALQTVDYSSKDCQVLILSNKAGNTAKIHKVLGHLCCNAEVHCCFEKRKLKTEIAMVKQKQPHIILGSPQRVSALIRKKSLQPNKIKVIVIDSSDRIFSLALSDEILCDILYVFSTLNSNIKILLLSSSVKRQVLDDFRNLAGKPFALVINKEEMELRTKQFYVLATDQIKKLECLHNLFKEIPITEAVVLCNTSEETVLLSKGIDNVHQDKESQQLHCICYCISVVKCDSKVANVQQKSLFINFSLPCKECYVERIKQCGILGKESIVINFVIEEEVTILDEITDTCRIDFVRVLTSCDTLQ